MTPLQKYRLKSLVTGIGLKGRPVRSQHTTMSQFCRHLRRRGCVPGTVIDVGVADGTFDIYTAFPDATYFLVEPLAEFEPALRWISSHYTAHYELAAAGARDGTAAIHVGRTQAEMHGASLAGTAQEGIYHGWARRTVPVRRLDRLVAAHDLPRPFLLKIDTQGTELDVLRGAEGLLPEIDVIILEVSFYNFGQRPNQPLVDDVFAYMAERGFFPYDIFGGYNRPLDDALAQVDIAFVKRDGRLRRDHSFDIAGRAVPLRHRLISQLRGWVNV